MLQQKYTKIHKTHKSAIKKEITIFSANSFVSLAPAWEGRTWIEWGADKLIILNGDGLTLKKNVAPAMDDGGPKGVGGESKQILNCIKHSQA